MAVVTTVLATFKASGAFKDLKKQGTALLGSLTGCKVKPKGTPHNVIWSKCPKFYFTYGSGIPGAGDFRNSRTGGYFDPLSGLWLSDYETTFPRDERKQIEATFRQRCESVTGDANFYAEVHPPSADKGVVRLNDNRIYAAEFYGVEGGSHSNPVILNVKPKGASDSPTIPAGSASPGSRTVSPFLPLALGFFLFRS